MTATADSEFAIGNLSKIAEDLGVLPEETGKYSLASILEALYASVENTNKQVSDLGTTITKLSGSISSLQVEVHNIRQEAVGVSSGQLNELADWTERELNRLWDNWNRSDNRNIESRLWQIENQLREDSGSNLDSRLRQMESRIQQIEWKLDDLQYQINSLRR
jgi:chromosome segregation ATPase